MLDTGANISALSESEANRLGLAVHEASTKLSDFTGTPGAIRFAEAPDLRIGRIHLKNVAFAVFPKNEWNDNMPNGHKGVLGIPVLLALASLRVEKGNRIVVGS
jgi:predicted aspartyl protease